MFSYNNIDVHTAGYCKLIIGVHTIVCGEMIIYATDFV